MAVAPWGRALAALLLGAAELGAWGGFTHQWLSLEALREAARDRSLGAVLRDPDLLDAFLGGSMAPDCGLDFFRARGNHRLQSLFHSDRFAARLLVRSRGDPVATARALGWRLHVIQDRQAGGHPAAYPNRKKTFRGRLRSRNHLMAEAMLDLLVLSRPGAPRRALSLDPGRVEQAAADLGETVTADEVERVSLRFAASTEAIRPLLEAIALNQAGGVLPSAARFYEDAREGLAERRGLARAREESVAWLRSIRPEVLALPEPPGAGPVQEDGPGLLAAALAATLPWAAADGSTAATLSDLQQKGWLRRDPMVQFFEQLSRTSETEFSRFVTEFERRRVRPR